MANNALAGLGGYPGRGRVRKTHRRASLPARVGARLPGRDRAPLTRVPAARPLSCRRVPAYPPQKVPKMDDHDDFARVMRENKRGANDFWYWKDKPVMEAGVARTVLESAGCEFQQLHSRHREDPPDCEAIIEGLRYGIEVTELVDEATLKAAIKGNSQFVLWARDQLCAELQKRIDRKDVPPEKVKGGPYDGYMLIIATDETAIVHREVEQFLEGKRFCSSFITDVLFGLSYDPGLKGYPIFQLSLVPRSPDDVRQQSRNFSRRPLLPPACFRRGVGERKRRRRKRVARPVHLYLQPPDRRLALWPGRRQHLRFKQIAPDVHRAAASMSFHTRLAP
jgi:hypothetical protein